MKTLDDFQVNQKPIACAKVASNPAREFTRAWFPDREPRFFSVAAAAKIL